MNLKRILSFAVNDKEINTIIDSILIDKGISSLFIAGMKYTKMKEEPPAFSLGFSLCLDKLELPIGFIFISEQLSHLLNQEELEFVIAHELGHIMLNHSVVLALTTFGKEAILELLISELKLTREKAQNIIGVLKLLIANFSKKYRTIEEEITAQTELEADKYSASLIKKKEPAISCLKKFYIENPSGLSHANRDGKFLFPALTLEERIKAIERLKL